MTAQMEAIFVARSASPAIDVEDPPRLAGAVPSPGGRSFLRRWRERRQQLIPGVPERAYDEPLITTRSLVGRMVLAIDPAAVRRVLVENVGNYPKTEMEQRFFTAIFGAGLLGTDGEVWRTHRRIMAPAFDPRSVASYAPAVTAAAEAFVARWRELGPGARVDMADEMTELTLRIIARTMFSAEDPELMAVLGGSLRGGLAFIGDLSLLDVLPITREARMRRREARIAEVFAPLDGLIAQLIDERSRSTQIGPADLLSRLMAASEGARMSPREVRDEVVTIFVAGHETTAMTMCWTWYLLSQHPVWLARLGAELDEVLGSRPPTQEDLPKLGLARRIVDESMRLYPAAPGLSARAILEDDVLAGHKVKKGSTVIILPWVTHRHRAWWDSPERFDPDRFLPERSEGRPRFAFLPFGAGPRVCIGNLLAVNESVLILASMARFFAPVLAADARVVLRHNVTLQPKYGLPMRLELRG